MREGPLAALDAVKQATGEDKVNAIGYCVGGTLLSIALAYLAAKGERVAVGDAVHDAGRFHLRRRSQGVRRRGADRHLEEQMAKHGYLEATRWRRPST